MPFISPAFIVFFLVVLLSLRLAPSRRLRYWILLAASAYFYFTWKHVYLLVLAAPIVIDYFCGIRIEESSDPRVRKSWLAAGVASNLLLLGYFKYANFFFGSAAVLVPIGISFFTFKAISYVIDIYRGDIEACRSPVLFATYVSYFPDLLAGPIVRASAFLPQMVRSLEPTWPHAVVGSQMILLGLTKKLVIADQMAPFVNAIFADAAAYSPLTVWSAVIAYSLEIYCDFSGYSDMAIGMSKIIGIDLPENFNMPYLAMSPIQFWRRWHITLTKWLRDYLYFSLPGLRKSRWHRYRNAGITALLGGLWHGASWTFVCWGAVHGLGIAVNHLWIARRRQTPSQSVLIRVSCWVTTYLFICLTWVLFRAQSFAVAGTVLRKMSGLAPGGIAWFYSPLAMVLPLVIGGHAVGIMAARRVHCNRITGNYVLLPLPGFAGAFLGTCWLLVLLLFGATGGNPFIYFQF
ncbi:MAG: MBOAT family protein [Bryobacteraceae bacterium]|jgi:alginate O-acetyltransferase complex protein AlgI